MFNYLYFIHSDFVVIFVWSDIIGIIICFYQIIFFLKLIFCNFI